MILAYFFFFSFWQQKKNRNFPPSESPCSFPSCLFLDWCQQNPNHSLRSWFHMRTRDKKLNNSGVFSQQKGRKKSLAFSFWKISTLFLTSNLDPASRTWPFYESIPTKDQITLFFKKAFVAETSLHPPLDKHKTRTCPRGEQNMIPCKVFSPRRNKRKKHLIGSDSISNNLCFDNGSQIL